MEIERKFRLESVSLNLLSDSGEKILQGYIVTENGELRIRRRSGDCFITVKGDGTISRDEWEEKIPGWVFDQLWPATFGRRLEKRRYATYHGWDKIEIDVYDGELNGLLTIECEFENEEEASKFELPDWAIGAVEVTQDKAYKNKNLALHGLPR